MMILDSGLLFLGHPVYYFAWRDCVFLLHIYIKNIHLSTLASAVIKLNHSVIIFPGKWRSGIRLSGKRLSVKRL